MTEATKPCLHCAMTETVREAYEAAEKAGDELTPIEVVRAHLACLADMLAVVEDNETRSYCFKAFGAQLSEMIDHARSDPASASIH